MVDLRGFLSHSICWSEENPQAQWKAVQLFCRLTGYLSVLPGVVSTTATHLGAQYTPLGAAQINFRVNTACCCFHGQIDIFKSDRTQQERSRLWKSSQLPFSRIWQWSDPQIFQTISPSSNVVPGHDTVAWRMMRFVDDKSNFHDMLPFGLPSTGFAKCVDCI